MKQFIHEAFIEENKIDLKTLSEPLVKKIERWNETKKNVYQMSNKLKRNKSIGELELMSNSIMEDIREEVEPAEEIKEPIVQEDPLPKEDTPVSEPAKKEEPVIKKKKSHWLAWTIGSLLLLGTAGAIIVDKKKSAN